jgi:hypothetical protein
MGIVPMAGGNAIVQTTTLPRLIDVSRSNPDRDVKASTWAAHTHAGQTDVWHYGTLMFTVSDDRDVTPISRGWGSQSDKCGVSRILQGWSEMPTTGADRVPVLTYAALYG